MSGRRQKALRREFMRLYGRPPMPTQWGKRAWGYEHPRNPSLNHAPSEWRRLKRAGAVA